MTITLVGNGACVGNPFTPSLLHIPSPLPLGATERSLSEQDGDAEAILTNHFDEE